MDFSHPDFTVVETLGQGASGSVYLAVQNKLNRKVAIKLVNDPFSGNSAQRFLREARILAQLDHPHIVSVYELVKLDNRPGFLMVMAYVEGGTLREQADRLTLRQALLAVKQIALALGYAHHQGFIHRDIKPENILFQGSSAMLADFGIARLTNSQTQMTQHGALLGTPAYMSPEQINGAPVDARSDLYSLGIVLYELLAGTPPYQAESAIATGIQQVTQQIPLLPPVFSCFQPLIERVLAKDKSARPADADTFLAEINEATGSLPWPLDEPLHQLRTQQPLTRKKVTMHQRPWPMTAVRGVVVIILALTFGGYYLLNELQPTDPAHSVPDDSVAAPTENIGRPQADGSTDESVVQPVIEDLQPGLVEVRPSPTNATTDNAIPADPQSDRIDALLTDAETLMRDGTWYMENNQAVSLYREVLEIAPDNATAEDALRYMTRETRQRVEKQLKNKQWGQVETTLAALEKNWSDIAGLPDWKTQYRRAHESDLQLQQKQARELKARQARDTRIQLLFSNAANAELQGRLFSPIGNNALFFYRAALTEDPRNTSSPDAIQRLKRVLIQQIKTNIDDDISNARSLLSSLKKAFPEEPAIAKLSESISAQQTKLENQARQKKLNEESKEREIEIRQLVSDVTSWQSHSDTAALSEYPLLAERITVMLRQDPQNQTLVRLQVQSQAHFAELNIVQTDTEADDDLFRMPGF